MEINSLILEVTDPVTGCIVEGIEFNSAEMPILLSLLEMEGVYLFGISYELSAIDISKIRNKFSNKFSNKIIEIASLRAMGIWDALPYKIHTGRELLMMLAGEKPLAVFCETYPSTTDYELIPESRFDPYVTTGLFLKREYIYLGKGNSRTRFILYARKSEAWRIEAYILLKNTATKFGWNEGFERIEGSLLGYEEWQNDIHVSEIFSSHKK